MHSTRCSHMTSSHTQTLSSCVQIGCGGVAVRELACMRACVRCDGDGRFMASSAARSLSTCMATANTPCGCQQTRAYASATAGSAIRPYKIEHEDRPVNAIRKFASARFRRLCSSTQFSSVASPVQQVKSEARTHKASDNLRMCAQACVSCWCEGWDRRLFRARSMAFALDSRCCACSCASRWTEAASSACKAWAS